MTQTVEDLKHELKDLLYECAMNNNILFTRHPTKNDSALFDSYTVLGIGCFGLDNMKRLKKLRFIIEQHEETGEDITMIALRYHPE